MKWRRDPESNRARRICNPLHNRFAIAPHRPSEWLDLNRTKKGSNASLFDVFGAGNEIRTRDLNLGKVALYQLSYSRIFSAFGVIRRSQEYNAIFQPTGPMIQKIHQCFTASVEDLSVVI
jgi:hypothetical protein